MPTATPSLQHFGTTAGLGAFGEYLSFTFLALELFEHPSATSSLIRPALKSLTKLSRDGCPSAFYRLSVYLLLSKQLQLSSSLASPL